MKMSLNSANTKLRALPQHQPSTSMECFTWLCNSLPEMMEKLDDLAKQVQTRQEEFERWSISSTDPWDYFATKRNGSMESLRPNDNTRSSDVETPVHVITKTLDTAPTMPMSTKVDVNPGNRRLFQEYREAARMKRKTTSIRSRTAGPFSPRLRRSMVIYYDSDIQTGFELMVTSLASARNTLRKGKNATSYKARMVSLAEEESPFDGNRSGVSMRNSRVPRFQKSSSPYSLNALSLEQFDQIDKELEIAQTLCEVGAHQFLRDACSTDELSGVRERLGTCLKFSKEAHDILKVEEGETQYREYNTEIGKLSQADDKPEPTVSDTTKTESRADTNRIMDLEIDSRYGSDKEIEIDDENGGISIDLPSTDLEIVTPETTEMERANSNPDLVQANRDKDNFSNTDTNIVEIDASSLEDEPIKIDTSQVRRAR